MKGHRDASKESGALRAGIAKEQVRRFYDELAPHLDRHRRRNAYYYELLGRVFRFLIPEGASVLDLGCGQGDFLAGLRPARGVGVDLSAAMIERARTKYPHLRFVVGDIEEQPLDEEDPFDYVLISNVVGFLEDIQKMFRALRPYVKPETRIVVTHFNYLWLPILKIAERLGMKVREPYQNWLSLGALENILNLEDFEVVKKRQAVLMPKNIPLLAPFLNRVVANLPLFWRLNLVEALVARPRMMERNSGASTCSVIVPARNEKGNIADLVHRLPRLGFHTEVVFVEGHSTDGTPEELDRVKAAYPDRDIRVLTQEGEGKADAVRKGFEAARGDVLIILDGDLTVPPEDLPKFFGAVCSGRGELVIGTRLVYQLQKESMRYLNLLGNKFFSLAFSYLLEQRITDTLCGTKALSRTSYIRIRESSDSFGTRDPFGDFNLIFGADKANLKIVEIPVRYSARQYGETQIRRFRHGFLLLRMVGFAVRRLKFL